ncbi:MAG: TetR/AcrR family transcriptional regulator [Alistipes sp.]|jgi:AcrR family transcriptional regulator|nr:TetR/AcrR family transcriptional regulator [Alistipes sp.]
MNQKERIVRAAAAMFLEEGIKSVRMDDIAVRQGVSKRTLYEMFSDKGDLLEQSLAYHFADKRRRMMEQTRGASNVIEEIFLILGAMREDDHDKALVRNLKKFYPAIYHRIVEEGHRFSFGEFNRLLDRGMEQGLLLPDMNKELALMTLVYTMNALFERRYLEFRLPRIAESSEPPSEPLSMRMAFEYVTVNFFRGLATHAGVDMIDELVENYKKNR